MRFKEKNGKFYNLEPSNNFFAVAVFLTTASKNLVFFSFPVSSIRRRRMMMIVVVAAAVACCHCRVVVVVGC